MSEAVDKLGRSVYIRKAVVYLHLIISQHKLYPSNAVRIKMYIVAVW